MPRHLYVERRACHRHEEVRPAAEVAEQEKHEHDRQQEIHDEVAELDESCDELVKRIDAILAAGIGQVSLSAA